MILIVNMNNKDDNSLAFNFSIFKAPLKALHSGAKIVVKSLLKAPPSRGLTIMKNNK